MSVGIDTCTIGRWFYVKVIRPSVGGIIGQIEGRKVVQSCYGNICLREDFLLLDFYQVVIGNIIFREVIGSSRIIPAKEKRVDGIPCNFGPVFTIGQAIE